MDILNLIKKSSKGYRRRATEISTSVQQMAAERIHHMLESKKQANKPHIPLPKADLVLSMLARAKTLPLTTEKDNVILAQEFLSWLINDLKIEYLNNEIRLARYKSYRLCSDVLLKDFKGRQAEILGNLRVVRSVFKCLYEGNRDIANGYIVLRQQLNEFGVFRRNLDKRQIELSRLDDKAMYEELDDFDNMQENVNRRLAQALKMMVIYHRTHTIDPITLMAVSVRQIIVQHLPTIYRKAIMLSNIDFNDSRFAGIAEGRDISYITTSQRLFSELNRFKTLFNIDYNPQTSPEEFSFDAHRSFMSVISRLDLLQNVIPSTDTAQNDASNTAQKQDEDSVGAVQSLVFANWPAFSLITDFTRFNELMTPRKHQTSKQYDLPNVRSMGDSQALTKRLQSVPSFTPLPFIEYDTTLDSLFCSEMRFVQRIMTFGSSTSDKSSTMKYLSKKSNDIFTVISQNRAAGIQSQADFSYSSRDLSSTNSVYSSEPHTKITSRIVSSLVNLKYARTVTLRYKMMCLLNYLLMREGTAYIIQNYKMALLKNDAKMAKRLRPIIEQPPYSKGTGIRLDVIENGFRTLYHETLEMLSQIDNEHIVLASKITNYLECTANNGVVPVRPVIDRSTLLLELLEGEVTLLEAKLLLVDKLTRILLHIRDLDIGSRLLYHMSYWIRIRPDIDASCLCTSFNKMNVKVQYPFHLLAYEIKTLATLLKDICNQIEIAESKSMPHDSVEWAKDVDNEIDMSPSLPRAPFISNIIPVPLVSKIDISTPLCNQNVIFENLVTFLDQYEMCLNELEQNDVVQTGLERGHIRIAACETLSRVCSDFINEKAKTWAKERKNNMNCLMQKGNLPDKMKELVTLINDLYHEDAQTYYQHLLKLTQANVDKIYKVLDYEHRAVDLDLLANWRTTMSKTLEDNKLNNLQYTNILATWYHFEFGLAKYMRPSFDYVLKELIGCEYEYLKANEMNLVEKVLTYIKEGNTFVTTDAESPSNTSLSMLIELDTLKKDINRVLKSAFKMVQVLPQWIIVRRVTTQRVQQQVLAHYNFGTDIDNLPKWIHNLELLCEIADIIIEIKREFWAAEDISPFIRLDITDNIDLLEENEMKYKIIPHELNLSSLIKFNEARIGECKSSMSTKILTMRRLLLNTLQIIQCCKALDALVLRVDPYEDAIGSIIPSAADTKYTSPLDNSNIEVSLTEPSFMNIPPAVIQAPTKSILSSVLDGFKEYLDTKQTSNVQYKTNEHLVQQLKQYQEYRDTLLLVLIDYAKRVFEQYTTDRRLYAIIQHLAVTFNISLTVLSCQLKNLVSEANLSNYEIPKQFYVSPFYYNYISVAPIVFSYRTQFTNEALNSSVLNYICMSDAGFENDTYEDVWEQHRGCICKDVTDTRVGGIIVSWDMLLGGCSGGVIYEQSIEYDPNKGVVCPPFSLNGDAIDPQSVTQFSCLPNCLFNTIYTPKTNLCLNQNIESMSPIIPNIITNDVHPLSLTTALANIPGILNEVLEQKSGLCTVTTGNTSEETGRQVLFTLKDDLFQVLQSLASNISPMPKRLALIHLLDYYSYLVLGPFKYFSSSVSPPHSYNIDAYHPYSSLVPMTHNMMHNNNTQIQAKLKDKQLKPVRQIDPFNTHRKPDEYVLTYEEARALKAAAKQCILEDIFTPALKNGLNLTKHFEDTIDDCTTERILKTISLHMEKDKLREMYSVSYDQWPTWFKDISRTPPIPLNCINQEEMPWYYETFQAKTNAKASDDLLSFDDVKDDNPFKTEHPSVAQALYKLFCSVVMEYAGWGELDHAGNEAFSFSIEDLTQIIDEFGRIIAEIGPSLYFNSKDTVNVLIDEHGRISNGMPRKITKRRALPVNIPILRHYYNVMDTGRALSFGVLQRTRALCFCLSAEMNARSSHLASLVRTTQASELEKIREVCERLLDAQRLVSIECNRLVASEFCDRLIKGEKRLDMLAARIKDTKEDFMLKADATIRRAREHAILKIAIKHGDTTSAPQQLESMGEVKNLELRLIKMATLNRKHAEFKRMLEQSKLKQIDDTKLALTAHEEKIQKLLDFEKQYQEKRTIAVGQLVAKLLDRNNRLLLEITTMAKEFEKVLRDAKMQIIQTRPKLQTEVQLASIDPEKLLAAIGCADEELCVLQDQVATLKERQKYEQRTFNQRSRLLTSTLRERRGRKAEAMDRVDAVTYVLDNMKYNGTLPSMYGDGGM